MNGLAGAFPLWAILTIWVVVNSVNVLQSIGFFSRIASGSRALNHTLGYVMVALGIPAAAALVALRRSGAPVIQWLGALVYLVFLAFMIVVDYAQPVEFRSPVRPAILVPYLVLFFGAIVLMGLPMYRLNRPLWLVTGATSAILIVSMMLAQRAGVG